MGHGKHVTGSSYPTPAAPAPVADYNVATNPQLSPDCSCNYFHDGEYAGYPYYRRADGIFFIWHRATAGEWAISHEIGEAPGGSWLHEDNEIEGVYHPWYAATGNATVSAGPH